jgi:site-specific recombinase XerD
MLRSEPAANLTHEGTHPVPRPIYIANTLISLYLRESRFSYSEETVTRGIVNRWCAYLQEGCSDACCAHRAPGAVQLSHAQRSDGVDYLNHLKRAGLAVATTNNTLTKLRKFYDWMITTNEMGKVKKKALPNPFATLKGDKPQRNIQPVLRDDAFRKLMKACDDSADDVIARRDRAILSLLMWSGLRREEITKLDRISYRDEDPSRPMLVVGTVQRTTKKKRARLVPLAPDTAALIDRYLIKRDACYSDEADAPLFMSQRGDRLTAQGVSQLFDRKKRAAGITGKLGVHSTRRGWCISGVKAGMSDRDLAKIAGWDSVDMVAYYSISDQDDLAFDAFYAKVAPQANTLQQRKARNAKPGRYGKRAA